MRKSYGKDKEATEFIKYHLSTLKCAPHLKQLYSKLITCLSFWFSSRLIETFFVKSMNEIFDIFQSQTDYDATVSVCVCVCYM